MVLPGSKGVTDLSLAQKVQVRDFLNSSWSGPPSTSNKIIKRNQIEIVQLCQYSIVKVLSILMNLATSSSRQ